MDWGLVNAIGITLMAAIGLWVLEREHRKLNKGKSASGSDEGGKAD